MDQEDVDEMRAQYFLLPATQRMRKTMEHRKSGALQELFNACNDSSDPVVRGAFCRYEVLGACVVELGGGK